MGEKKNADTRACPHAERLPPTTPGAIAMAEGICHRALIRWEVSRAWRRQHRFEMCPLVLVKETLVFHFVRKCKDGLVININIKTALYISGQFDTWCVGACMYEHNTAV